MAKCACGNEQRKPLVYPTPISYVDAIKHKVIKLPYHGGMQVLPDGSVQCWFCAFPHRNPVNEAEWQPAEHLRPDWDKLSSVEQAAVQTVVYSLNNHKNPHAGLPGHLVRQVMKMPIARELERRKYERI